MSLSKRMSTGRKRLNITKSPTLLEHLPNEIFISIYSYLTGVDAVWAFSNLNYRFYHLSNRYCYLFDFKSINKTKFDFILNQQYNKQQWKSLQFSDDDYDTPGQFEYFSQFYSLVDLCPELQSLSLLNIKSISQNNQLLLSNLSTLTNLQSLTLTSLCGTIICQFDFSKLKRLVISSCLNMNWMKVKSFK